MAEILLLEPNLFFSSRVAAAAGKQGHRLTTVGSLERLKEALQNGSFGLLILHFGLPQPVWEGAMETRSVHQPELPVVAYGPHEDVTAFRRLRELGASKVLARGKFVRDLPRLIEEHLAAGRT